MVGEETPPERADRGAPSLELKEVEGEGEKALAMGAVAMVAAVAAMMTAAVVESAAARSAPTVQMAGRCG